MKMTVSNNGRRMTIKTYMTIKYTCLARLLIGEFDRPSRLFSAYIITCGPEVEYD